MKEALRQVEAAILSGGGVLIQGEPGTDCEEIARAIHHASAGDFDGSVESLLRRSMRRELPRRGYVEVDCRDRNAVEHGLFGTPSEDGLTDQISHGSALHEALDGTLVLRDLPELPARLQVRLARILRDREVLVAGPAGTQRIGSVSVRPIGTMAVGAEEQIVPELHSKVGQTTIQLPPLRDRREDIPAIVRYQLADVCAAQGLPPKSASTQAVELLTALPWRGNTIELREVLKQLARKVPGRLIRLSDVLGHIRLDGRTQTTTFHGLTLKEARERFEREYVSAVLEHHHGRMSEAAKALGIQRTNLYRKVRQLSVARRRAGVRDSQ